MNAAREERRRLRLSERAAISAGRLLPAAAIARAAAGGSCLLPYYHVVSDEWLPHVSPLYRFRSVREFHADLEFLLRHYQPVGLAELLAAPGRPPHSLLLTFDDGFREIHDVIAPILRAKGVPAAFFLTSGGLGNQLLCAHQKTALLLDRLAAGVSATTRAEIGHLVGAPPGTEANLAVALRKLGHRDTALIDAVGAVIGIDFAGFLASAQPYLTEEQARSLLAQGFELGAHSIDHPLYSQLSVEEQLRQTRDSMASLQERLGLKRRVFAFPHSDDGVSAAFFTRLAADGGMEATFGTSAPHLDPTPRHFQRFSMEKEGMSAAAILAHQAIRRAKQRVAGSRPLQRDGFS